jgi:hypothetical protein
MPESRLIGLVRQNPTLGDLALPLKNVLRSCD